MLFRKLTSIWLVYTPLLSYTDAKAVITYCYSDIIFNENLFALLANQNLEFSLKLFWLLISHLHGSAPSYLSSIIYLRCPWRYSLRNSNVNISLSYPSFISKATLGDRSYTCTAPMVWNALFKVKCAKSVDVFKVKLKHSYLVQHFYYHNLVSTLFWILVCNILSL